MFIDAVAIQGKPRFTKDGYLVATAKVARTGIQLYTGAEVGRPELEVVRVYRPESEVFNKDSLASYVGKPMTDDHPVEDVNAGNWKELSIGGIGEGVLREGEYVRIPLLMMDAKAIEKYNEGKVELSMGYDAEIVFEAGITDSGEEYDAYQKNIRINHVALVDAGRAGGARIGDTGGHVNSPTLTNEVKTMTKSVKFGDVTIEVSEQAAEAIAALSKQIEEAKAEAEKAQAEAQDQLAAKDKELAAKDAQIDELKSQSMTADKLDAAIAERVALIGEAKKIADVAYSGDAAAIRKQAVVAALGDAAIEGKSEAYIAARFDVLHEGVKTSTAGSEPIFDAADNGHGKFIDSLKHGYKRGN